MEEFITFLGNHYLLSSAWVVLFILIVVSLIQSRLSPVKSLNTHEATMQMNRQDAVVVDIRSKDDFGKGHILGSKNISQEQLNNSDFKALEKDKAKPIIVVCAAGLTATKAAQQMLKAGFEQVSILQGGMNAWTAASLPVSKK